MPPARVPAAAGVWSWTDPLRKLKRRRRRFASFCFLGAGIALGSAVYLLLTRADRTFDPLHLPLFLGLVALMIALYWLGANAEAEVTKIDEEIAELEAEAIRLLNQRG